MELAGWSNFYMITGSAAAALTGLQFIVQTLLATVEIRQGASDAENGTAAFGTPTVVHFSLALLISAVMSAPWAGYGSLRAALIVIGCSALVYSAIVVRRMRRQRVYVTTAYDWTWYFAMPAVAYVAILFAAVMLGAGTTSYFMTAAATLLLICNGIHNSWDTVTFLTISAMSKKADAAK